MGFKSIIIPSFEPYHILTWPSLTHPLRIKCPHCYHMAFALKTHPVAGEVCAACMDKLSVLGGLRPPARSASKRDPNLDFDDLGLPGGSSLGPDRAGACRTNKVRT